jgi:pyridoxine 4-dehydrogenase
VSMRRIGFGAMHLDAGDGRAASIALLREVVELGVDLIDTAHLYGGGANEELIAEALHPYAEGLLVTTKVGVSKASGEWRLDGRPEVLRDQVEQALRRLRVERVELLQLHRIDPETPLADQVGTLKELRDEGKIARIGLSEVTVAQLAEARGIVDIASVQNRYNVLDREHEPVLKACADEGITFLPWRPVAAGKSGTTSAVAEVAARTNHTATQVALAWLLARSPVIRPIPGTTSRAHLEENLAAEQLQLSPEQMAQLTG